MAEEEDLGDLLKDLNEMEERHKKEGESAGHDDGGSDNERGTTASSSASDPTTSGEESAAAEYVEDEFELEEGSSKDNSPVSSAVSSGEEDGHEEGNVEDGAYSTKDEEAGEDAQKPEAAQPQAGVSDAGEEVGVEDGGETLLSGGGGDGKVMERVGSGDVPKFKRSDDDPSISRMQSDLPEQGGTTGAAAAPGEGEGGYEEDDFEEEGGEVVKDVNVGEDDGGVGVEVGAAAAAALVDGATEKNEGIDTHHAAAPPEATATAAAAAPAPADGGHGASGQTAAAKQTPVTAGNAAKGRGGKKREDPLAEFKRGAVPTEGAYYLSLGEVDAIEACSVHWMVEGSAQRRVFHYAVRELCSSLVEDVIEAACELGAQWDEEQKKVKKTKFIGAFSELRGAELARRAATMMQMAKDKKMAEERAERDRMLLERGKEIAMHELESAKMGLAESREKVALKRREHRRLIAEAAVRAREEKVSAIRARREEEIAEKAEMIKYVTRMKQEDDDRKAAAAAESEAIQERFRRQERMGYKAAREFAASLSESKREILLRKAKEDRMYVEEVKRIDRAVDKGQHLMQVVRAQREDAREREYAHARANMQIKASISRGMGDRVLSPDSLQYEDSIRGSLLTYFTHPPGDHPIVGSSNKDRAFSPIRSPPNSQLRKKKLAEAEMRLIATYDWCTARQEAATCEVLAACLSSFGVPTSQEDAESACLGLGGSINAQDKEGGGLSKSDFVDAGVALFAGTLKEKGIRRVVELGGVQARAVTASIGAGARKGGPRTSSSRLAKSMPSTRCVSPEEKGNGHGGEVGKAEGRHSWSFPKDVLGKHLGRVGAGGMKKSELAALEREADEIALQRLNAAKARPSASPTHGVGGDVRAPIASYSSGGIPATVSPQAEALVGKQHQKVQEQQPSDGGDGPRAGVPGAESMRKDHQLGRRGSKGSVSVTWPDDIKDQVGQRPFSNQGGRPVSQGGGVSSRGSSRPSSRQTPLPVALEFEEVLEEGAGTHGVPPAAAAVGTFGGGAAAGSVAEGRRRGDKPF